MGSRVPQRPLWERGNGQIEAFLDDLLARYASHTAM